MRNNWSRIGGLDYIVGHGGAISDAVSAQVWSGEASVHVSIVNWVKNGVTRPPYHLSIQRGDSVESPWEKFELPRINSSLTSGHDVTDAAILETNVKASRVYNGQFPRHSGFVIDPKTARDLLKRNPRNCKVVHPFLIGREMLVEGEPQRFVIDFQKRDLFEAQSYPEPFEHVRANVLPHVEELARQEHEKTGKSTGQNQLWLKTWWQMFRSRKELIDKISKLSRYLVCSEVTKRAIFSFVHPDIRPDHTLEALIFEDDYSFGVIQSDLHARWFTAKGSRLTGRFRYTPETVFDTFPWPQEPTRAQIAAVAESAVALRTLRRETMQKLNCSLRELYRTLDQPGDNPLREAHARLDVAVCAGYGMHDEVDPLAFLLELNLACAAEEKAGDKITPPGLPLASDEQQAFVTNDCIRAPTL